MNKLPPETLRKVFECLHLKQKLECTLVCRSWARILADDNYLLETITMLSLPTAESLNRRVIELIRKTSDDQSGAGNKCKRLVLENKRGAILADKADLARVFPNLEFFFLESNELGPSAASVITSDQVDLFQGWRNHLKTLIDWSYNGVFFSQLFDSGVFNQLITLGLIYISQGPSIHDLFKRLKNAPFLTTLDLSVFNASVFDFEVLHSNTPNLTSLYLGGVVVFDLNQVESLSVAPAKQLKTLKLRANFRARVPRSFLIYISRKYTYLNEFDISCTELMENRLLSTIRTNSLAATLVWDDLLANIGPTLMKCRIRYKEMSLGVFDKLLKHAPNLKSLSIECDSYSTLYKHDLTHPLFQCLQALSVLDVPSTIELSTLQDLKGLRELNLTGDSTRGPVMLNDLIIALPKHIATLGLTQTLLAADSKMVDQQSSLVHLKFTKVTFDTSAIQFIESRFEKLTCLSLDYCQGIDKLELPNHRLSFVEMNYHAQVMSMVPCDDDRKLMYTKQNTHLQLITSNQTSYYKMPILEGTRFKKRSLPLFDVHDHAIQHTLMPSPVDEELKYFRFKCAYVQSFYFCDYLVI